MIYETREERAHRQHELAKEFETIVIIRPNFPGKEKKNPVANFVSLLMMIAMEKELPTCHRETMYKEEGLIFLLGTAKEALEVKEYALQLEENHPLGRLVDIDVMNTSGEMSRRELGHDERKCFICSKRAVLCVRNRTHALDEVIDFFYRQVETYLMPVDKKERFLRTLLFAITTELSRIRTYGCVGFSTTGVHADMDAGTFIDSTKALLGILKEMPEETTFQQLRTYGVEGEKKLMQATQGINAQKGLHFFSLLLFDAYLNCDFKSMKDYIFNRTQSLKEDLMHLPPHLSKENCGARGHALEGFDTLFENVDRAKNIDACTLWWMQNTDDTTAIRRRGIEFWRKAQAMAKPEGTLEKKDYFNEFCIKEGISTGGVADLVTCTLTLYLLKEEEDGNQKKSRLRDIQLQ